MNAMCCHRLGGGSIHAFMRRSPPGCEGMSAKAIYRFVGRQTNNWRLAMLRMQLSISAFLKANASEAPGTTRCLIIDDTVLGKTGRHIESVSKVYSHLRNTFELGYKLLACALFDGKTTTCVNFALLRESKRRGYGLRPGEQKRQFAKRRERTAPGAQRAAELDEEKPRLVVGMLSRLVKAGISARYVLFDSWFTTGPLVGENRRVGGGVLHVVGRMKERIVKVRVGRACTPSRGWHAPSARAGCGRAGSTGVSTRESSAGLATRTCRCSSSATGGATGSTPY